MGSIAPGTDDSKSPSSAANGLVWTAPARKGGLWTVEQTTPPGLDTINPQREADRRRVAKVLGVSAEELLVSWQAHNETGSGASDSRAGLSVRIRGLHEPISSARTVGGDTPQGALTAALAESNLPAEAVMEWADRGSMLALDLDAHDGLEHLRLRDQEDLSAFFSKALPGPCAAWRTHGGGLRAVFVAVDGMSAPALAGAWYLFAHLGRLASFKVEALTRSRHPGVCRGDEHAGPVIHMVPSADFTLNLSSGIEVVHEPTEDEIRTWLEDRGMEIGRRYAHGYCPFSPTKQIVNPSVVVSQAGITCFRCDRNATFGRLISGHSEPSERPSLVEAAQNYVHAAHARLVIRDLRPNMPDDLVDEAWRAIVLRVHGLTEADLQRDPPHPLAARVLAATSAEGPDIIRGISGWLDAATLERRNPTHRTAAALPWSGGDGVRQDKILDTQPLAGFVPVVPVDAGTVINPHARELNGGGDRVVVKRKRRANSPLPVDLGEAHPDVAAVEDGWAYLRETYPGIPRGYLTSILAGALAAQRASGIAPMVVVSGPTGSSKTVTAKLASAMLMCPLNDAALADPTTTRRHLGLALECGPGVVLIDEIGRVEDAYHALAPLLTLSGESVTFEAKYRNPQRAPLTSIIVLAGSSIPTAVACSPELERRVAAYRLEKRVPEDRDWSRHGDIGDARRDERRRYALDTVTSSIWWRLHDEGPSFNWRAFCYNETGAVRLRELAQGGEEEVRARAGAIRALYEAWHGAEDGDLLTGGHWRARPDYLDCSPGSSGHELLAEFVEPQADRKIQFAQAHDAQQIDLAPLLPEVVQAVGPIRLVIHRHGQRVGVKFEVCERLRGTVVRRQFPPLASVSPDSPSRTGGVHA